MLKRALGKIQAIMKISIEVFPGKNYEDFNRISSVAKNLEYLEPRFTSVTFGATGSSFENSLELIKTLQCKKIIPHLTFARLTKKEISTFLNDISQLGIDTILALRGDKVNSDFNSKKFFQSTPEFIRYLRNEGFKVIVSAYAEKHPNSLSSNEDINWLEQKIDAGANTAITQFAMNNIHYENLLNQVERKNLDVELVAGLLPIKTVSGLKKMASFCEIEVPLQIYKAFGDKNEDINVSSDIFKEQYEFVKNIGYHACHIYTLNHQQILDNIFKGGLND